MSKLVLDNTGYTYKDAQRPSVVNVNCEFTAGRLYAIAGPSGSGKSTLLSMLAGLDLPTEGKVIFDGVNLAELDPDRYRRESIAMIFQAFHLLSALTVIENVCYPLELIGARPHEAKSRAEKLLLSMGITKEQMKRLPSKLSGGEQQRVAIARSLAAGAKILLADEPTGNLDVANTEKIMKIFKNLAQGEGYCIIIVTHDMEVARLADINYHMKDGKLTTIVNN
jgi:putative ABC transport system ATP-binding protein